MSLLVRLTDSKTKPSIITQCGLFFNSNNLDALKQHRQMYSMLNRYYFFMQLDLMLIFVGKFSITVKFS